MKEEEKVEVQGSVGKALTENFTKHNLIAKHHNVVESEEDLEDEDVEMTDSSSKPEDSVEAEDLSNLQLAWEMFELAKVPCIKCLHSCTCLVPLGDLWKEGEGHDGREEDGGAGFSVGGDHWVGRGDGLPGYFPSIGNVCTHRSHLKLGIMGWLWKTSHPVSKPDRLSCPRIPGFSLMVSL